YDGTNCKPGVCWEPKPGY
nr:RecName: Full=Methanol dehydrogenase [cytochrome c] subunit 2; AltName: Full=MDH small subunit beta [Methylomonas sp.]